MTVAPTSARARTNCSWLAGNARLEEDDVHWSIRCVRPEARHELPAAERRRRRAAADAQRRVRRAVLPGGDDALRRRRRRRCRTCSVGLVSSEPRRSVPGALAASLGGHWPHRRLPRRTTSSWTPSGRPGARLARSTGLLAHPREPPGAAGRRCASGSASPGWTPQTADNFRDKARMKDVLRAAGVPCARHRLARTPSRTALRFAAERCGFPFVAKPLAGAGAQGDVPHRRRRAAAAMARAVAPPDPGRPALLEEFVVGRRALLRQRRDRRPAASGTRSAATCRRRSTCSSTRGSSGACCCRATSTAPSTPTSRDARHRGAHGARACGPGSRHMEWFRRADGSRRHLRGRRPPARRAVHDAHVVRPRRRPVRRVGARWWSTTSSIRPSAGTRSAPPTCAPRAAAAIVAVHGLDQVSAATARAGRRGPPARARRSRRRAATRATATSSSAHRDTDASSGPSPR